MSLSELSSPIAVRNAIAEHDRLAEMLFSHCMDTVALCVVCFLPLISIGQECSEARMGSVAEAAEYLQHASTAVTPLVCVQAAFQRIANAPSAEAVPLLLQYLSFKRPLNEGEKQGIFIHGRTSGHSVPGSARAFYDRCTSRVRTNRLSCK